MSVTLQNLESALAGESMAHIKYRYFAKLARAAGDIETAMRIAHSLKGVSSTFGMSTLQYHAAALEQEIKNGGSETGTLSNQTEEELDRLCRELKSVLEVAAESFPDLNS